MSSRRSRTKLRGDTVGGRFIVVCRRYDGREKQWNRYVDRAEAEQVATRLTALGCLSRVATDDDLPLEGAA
jgi:hypothetical protein